MHLDSCHRTRWVFSTTRLFRCIISESLFRSMKLSLTIRDCRSRSSCDLFALNVTWGLPLGGFMSTVALADFTCNRNYQVYGWCFSAKWFVKLKSTLKLKVEIPLIYKQSHMHERDVNKSDFQVVYIFFE